MTRLTLLSLSCARGDSREGRCVVQARLIGVFSFFCFNHNPLTRNQEYNIWSLADVTLIAVASYSRTMRILRALSHIATIDRATSAKCRKLNSNITSATSGQTSCSKRLSRTNSAIFRTRFTLVETSALLRLFTGTTPRLRCQRSGALIRL